LESAAALPTLPDAAAVFHGFTSQNLYLASAVQTAVMLGHGAAAGLRAEPETLERHFGAWVARDREGFAARLDSLIGPPQREPQEWTIRDGYLKRHPTCALLHGVNDAVEDLARAHRLKADDIVVVRVRTYGAAAGFDGAAPGNDLSARFSIPWTVACGLALGGLDPAFESAALGDDTLRALARRVHVEHDPALDADYPAGRPGAVSVTLTNGATLEATVAGPPRGDGPTALTDPDVRRKPEALLTEANDRDWAEAVLASIAALGEHGVRPVGALLRRAKAPPP
jgi:2-methylcitrate dehydratase PrpD